MQLDSVQFELLIAEYLSGISDLWQIWLALTFAFIVAFHVGRASITKLLTFLGCGLYAIAAGATILRYLSSILFVIEIRDSMGDLGLQTFGEPVFASSIFLLTFGTMFIGTLVAIWFAIYQYRASNDT